MLYHNQHTCHPTVDNRLASKMESRALRIYVMLGLFVASMAYFIFVSRREIALRKQRLLEDSGIDLLPYVRYAKASISLLYLTAALLPVTILYNTLLIIIGPLMILNIVFFVQSFISLGYYITPSEEILGGQEELDEEELTLEPQQPASTEAEASTVVSPILSREKVEEMELALKKWCDEGLYKNSQVNIYSLASNLGYKKMS